MKKYKIIISITPLMILAGALAFYLMPQSEVEASIQQDVVTETKKEELFGPATVYDADPDILMAQLPKSVTPKEFRCLAQAVYFEARSEPIEGQVAVAYVIMNRVKDSRYPSSICGVVFQNKKMRHRCQFSFACDGLSDNPYEKDAWTQARRVAGGALINNMSDVTSRSTHYHAKYVNPSWAKSMRHTIQVGQHIFYREEF